MTEIPIQHKDGVASTLHETYSDKRDAADGIDPVPFSVYLVESPDGAAAKNITRHGITSGINPCYTSRVKEGFIIFHDRSSNSTLEDGISPAISGSEFLLEYAVAGVNVPSSNVNMEAVVTQLFDAYQQIKNQPGKRKVVDYKHS